MPGKPSFCNIWGVHCGLGRLQCELPYPPINMSLINYYHCMFLFLCIGLLKTMFLSYLSIWHIRVIVTSHNHWKFLLIFCAVHFFNYKTILPECLIGQHMKVWQSTSRWHQLLCIWYFAISNYTRIIYHNLRTKAEIVTIFHMWSHIKLWHLSSCLHWNFANFIYLLWCVIIMPHKRVYMIVVALWNKLYQSSVLLCNI